MSIESLGKASPQLAVQLSDDFSRPVPGRWQNWRQGFEVVDGAAVLRATIDGPPGPPPKFGFCGLATVEKYFNPGLVGTNVLEAILAAYAHKGEYMGLGLRIDGTQYDEEDPVGGHYIMGWTLTIATYRAQTGATQGKRDRRSVQLILDWWSETGVDMILVRDVIAGDEKLPRHDADKDTAATVPKPCVAFPSVILWATNFPCSKGGMGDKPWGHRFGLRLAGDGTHLSWSLDGVEMGGAEIPGHYFGDIAEAVSDGAYATIAAAGSHRESLWKVDDVSILAST